MAVKLCINVADTLENLMGGTQAVNELEAILQALSPLDAVADNWYRALTYVCKMLMNCLSQIGH